MTAALHDRLVLARRSHWEDPAGALQTAVECLSEARSLGATALQSRALTVQGAVSLHRGDLKGAFALAGEAERLAAEDVHARTELAALDTGLHFFSGSYGACLRNAELAVALADEAGDLQLRIHARRMGCLAFGNLGVPDFKRRLDEVLELTITAGDTWEEAISRNDLGHYAMAAGDVEEAGRQLELGLVLATRAGFARGVLHCTRAELRLGTGRAGEALADALTAVELLTARDEANPYLLGMTVLIQVRALLALGRVEAARRAGEAVVAGLGDRVPAARSMILGAVAEALREAGRHEEAYDALFRGAELEREAFREFTQLQLGLERARLEVAATRREADALSEKNQELERLQDQLREQADRDWLTGLRNRRYLARAHDAGVRGPVALAVLDLDHFKAVNDRFGHQAGDQVLIRVAELLVEHVRKDDVVIRTGGEEFAVLMPATGPAEARACCERLRAVIGAEPWDAVAPGAALTASIGLVAAPAAGDLDSLGRVADERMYSAKRAGRDRVVAA